MSIYLDIDEELALDGEAEQQIWLEYCEMANDEDYDQAPDYYATEDLY